jgi:hypothetical protein
VAIDLDPGDRKLDDHKVKIVAVERGIVGYVRDWAIQHGRGHSSRQISTPLSRVILWHTHVMPAQRLVRKQRKGHEISSLFAPEYRSTAPSLQRFKSARFAQRFLSMRRTYAYPRDSDPACAIGFEMPGLGL